MQITDRTIYREFEAVERFVSDNSAKLLTEKAEDKFGRMYDLEFRQFWACSTGDFSGVLGDMSEPTVLQVYWAKRFGKFVEEFTDVLKRLTIAQTPEEKQASNGLLHVNWDEAILVFVREYFGLHSFREAERITMGEILIAKRAAYNSDKFRRRLSDIQTAKLHRKK